MKELAVKYAMCFIGRPYIWGGDDPLRGFDCSGLVQEILASVGMDPPGDQTAQTLFEYFMKHGLRMNISPGSLLFFGTRDLATHVAFCVSDKMMIEAGGGGSKTLTVEDAIRQNAYIRIRPIDSRRDLKGALTPQYKT